MKKKPIPSILLSCVKSTDRERFEKAYNEYNYVLSIIKEALEKELESISNKQESTTIFEKPNWREHQAFLLGERKRLKACIKLFN